MKRPLLSSLFSSGGNSPFLNWRLVVCNLAKDGKLDGNKFKRPFLRRSLTPHWS